jgi:hypothetical protein
VLSQRANAIRIESAKKKQVLQRWIVLLCFSNFWATVFSRLSAAQASSTFAIEKAVVMVGALD